VRAGTVGYAPRLCRLSFDGNYRAEIVGGHAGTTRPTLMRGLIEGRPTTAFVDHREYRLGVGSECLFADSPLRDIEDGRPMPSIIF